MMRAKPQTCTFNNALHFLHNAYTILTESRVFYINRFHIKSLQLPGAWLVAGLKASRSVTGCRSQSFQERHWLQVSKLPGASLVAGFKASRSVIGCKFQSFQERHWLQVSKLPGPSLVAGFKASRSVIGCRFQSFQERHWLQVSKLPEAMSSRIDLTYWSKCDIQFSHTDCYYVKMKMGGNNVVIKVRRNPRLNATHFSIADMHPD